MSARRIMPVAETGGTGEMTTIGAQKAIVRAPKV
jgi:hypothetical protein